MFGNSIPRIKMRLKKKKRIRQPSLKKIPFKKISNTVISIFIRDLLYYILKVNKVIKAGIAVFAIEVATALNSAPSKTTHLAQVPLCLIIVSK